MRSASSQIAEQRLRYISSMGIALSDELTLATRPLDLDVLGIWDILDVSDLSDMSDGLRRKGRRFVDTPRKFCMRPNFQHGNYTCCRSQIG